MGMTSALEGGGTEAGQQSLARAIHDRSSASVHLMVLTMRGQWLSRDMIELKRVATGTTAAEARTRL